jgi:hypothetical protein
MRAIVKSGHRLGRCLRLFLGMALSCGLVLAQATARAATISPSLLEVNLGPVPIDLYSSSIANNGTFPSCAASQSVRSCMQTFLANYAWQGVSGVRFQLGLGGGYVNSTAFNASGQLRDAWIDNLSMFFYDLRAVGIRRITPTTALDEDWSGTLQSETVAYRAGTGCPTGSKTLLFLPWLPFGLDPVTHQPDGVLQNDSYTCAPANPGFWGWLPYFQLVDVVAAEARATGLTIEEWDIQNELNLYYFTVQGRLIYDNTSTPPTPVRAMVDQLLSQAGFAGAATYSVAAGNPASGNATCRSVYGDPAVIVTASELLAAFGGGKIGAPPYVAGDGTLPCDASAQPCATTMGAAAAACATAGMVTLANQSAPPLTDIHVYPCTALADGSCAQSTDTTALAQATYSAIQIFLQANGRTAGASIIGETDADSANSGCDDHTPAMATQNVAGYLASTLYQQRAAATVVRPWGNLTNGACPQQLLGAPGGPYTP